MAADGANAPPGVARRCLALPAPGEAANRAHDASAAETSAAPSRDERPADGFDLTAPLAPAPDSWSAAATRAAHASYDVAWGEGADAELQKTKGSASNTVRGALGRTPINGPLQLALPRGLSLKQMSSSQRRAAIERGLGELLGIPIEMSVDWSLRPADATTGVSLSPHIPGEQAAQAIWLPLEATHRYAQLKLLADSHSAAAPGKWVEDWQTGQRREVRRDDGAYLALFFVRNRGELVPLHQGPLRWPENTKFVDELELDTLFDLHRTPFQATGAIGVVAVNVSAPSAVQASSGKRFSNIDVLELSAGWRHREHDTRVVLLKEPSSVGQEFAQLPLKSTPTTKVERLPSSEPFTFTATRNTRLHVYVIGRWNEGFTVTRADNTSQQLGVKRLHGTVPQSVPPEAEWVKSIVDVEVAAGETVTLSGDTLYAVGIDEELTTQDAAPSAIEARAHEPAMTGVLPTHALSELLRHSYPLAVLVEALLEKLPLRQRLGWHAADDVLFSLSSGQLAEHFAHVLQRRGLDENACLAALEASDPMAAANALGFTATDTAALLQNPDFVATLFAACAAVDQQPLQRFLHVLEAREALSAWPAAQRQASEIELLLRLLSKNDGRRYTSVSQLRHSPPYLGWHWAAPTNERRQQLAIRRERALHQP